MTTSPLPFASCYTHIQHPFRLQSSHKTHFKPFTQLVLLMAYMQWVPMPTRPAPAPQAAAPKNAWVRLREAQDEAVRNAQPAPLRPAPAAAPATPAASPVAIAVSIPTPVVTLEPVKGYYYYYPVLHHCHQQLLKNWLTPSQQPVYAPPPAMIAQPVYHGQHTIVYQQPAQAVEPAKPEEPKLTGNPAQEFYCREFDGSWSLRTATAIEKECRPGFWQSSESGFPVFYRTKP